MKKNPYPDFWEKIHDRARTNGFPLRVMFELTYECNFKCRHCYVPQTFKTKYRARQLSTAGVFSVIDRLKRLGCLYLGFTGGEPFVRRDIFPIITRAVQSGFQVIVYTNGSLIDADAAERLARLALNKLDITLPAMTDEAFDKITGTTGMRRKVFNAIRHLHAQGAPLGFKTCVVKENASEIKAIRAFARSLKAAHRLDSGPSPRLDGDKEPLRYSCENILKEADSRPGRKDTTVAKGMFACGAGRSQAAVTPAGELKMCVMRHYPLYPVSPRGLNHAWERLKSFTGSLAVTKPGKGALARSANHCTLCPAQR